MELAGHFIKSLISRSIISTVIFFNFEQFLLIKFLIRFNLFETLSILINIDKIIHRYVHRYMNKYDRIIKDSFFFFFYYWTATRSIITTMIQRKRQSVSLHFLSSYSRPPRPLKICSRCTQRMHGEDGRNLNGVHIFSRRGRRRSDEKGPRSNSWLLFVYTEGSKTPETRYPSFM